MTEDELEKLLTAARLTAPTEDFLATGMARIHSAPAPRSLPWGWAVAAALCISVTLNLWYFLAESPQPGNSAPSVAVSEAGSLPYAALPAGSPAMRFLCLIRTPVIVDDNFQLGELNGFGEWLVLEISSLADISLSLNSLRDWQEIGSWDNGTIELNLPDNHLLKIAGVGLGPNDIRSGNSLPVYGEVRVNNERVLTADDAVPQTAYPAALRNNVNLATSSNPFRNRWRVTTGFDTALSPNLIQSLGPLLDSNRCG